MGTSLQDRTVLVVGRGGGIARAITLAARDAGASVVAAGRDQAELESAYDGKGITDEYVDLTDEASIDALGLRLGTVDHVISTASARARGRVADLDREAVRLAFDTKVIGPMMLAKHLAGRMPQDGSFVFFSGRHRGQARDRDPGRGRNKRGGRHGDPVARAGTRPDPGQRRIARRRRHRRLGRSR